MNAVELQGITKTFNGTVAVDGLSLTVPQGSVYGFIGPNGSGKTTTLRMLMRIFYPDRGDIRVLGKPVSQAPLDRIGYLPEERGLYRKMKLWEALTFLGELRGGSKVDDQVDAWLKRLDLADRGADKVEQLSKGMSQKAQFIAAVVPRPDLLILDEPFSGLDPVNADVIREAVLDLSRQGTTIIFSTHDMGVAEQLCDYVFMIFRGRKVLDGTLEDIKGQYGDDTIRVTGTLRDEELGQLPGVVRVGDLGHVKELRLTADADTQSLLSRIVSMGPVDRLEVARPSLHDIFVRIAGPEGEASYA
ncbi:ABC transporter ATP-binding protein [Candidatus Latescibacterota bacterium]